MSRTTLDLDPVVLNKIRKHSKEQQKSMGRFASELLAKGLAQLEGEKERVSFEWMSAELGSPQVDIEDKEALRALLDRKA